MRLGDPSLKRRLIIQPLIVQLILSLITFAAFMTLIIRIDSGGKVAEDAVSKIVANAIIRSPDGRLAVRETPELAEIRRNSTDLWFVARDEHGQTVSLGPVPAQYATLVNSLEDLAFADIRALSEPYHLSAVIRRETGPVGKLTILAHGKVTGVTLIVAFASNVIIAPIFVVIALVTMFTTPWIVNRSLAGVARTAAEAGTIDVDKRGTRLSEEAVPREIKPLVRAVNGALTRLDEGYDKQKRFIASAAHELRTPIAILQVKIESGDAATQQRLSGEVARLANLAEQLLDTHRLENDAPTEIIHLDTLARQVAGDLAPLLIASNKTIAVEIEHPGAITGNIGAIERVMINLIQNSVEHGGDLVTVRVNGPVLEVEDNGEGIPADARERVFEPFHRLRPRQTGTGLGLNLVKQVVERHHGRVVIMDAPDGGVIMRVEFPAQNRAARTST